MDPTGEGDRLRVHQYHSGTAVADAVTNSLFYTRSMLRELGFESEIFCSYPDAGLGDEVQHISKWDERADLLLVHHSMGIADESWLLSVACKKVLVYHNITPATFFSDQPHIAEYVELGLKQAQRWRPMFSATIADSDQNKHDLVELGYAQDEIDVVPLLLDLEIRRGIVPTQQIESQLEGYFNVLFVGRLVANKCQHEIVQAYARTHVRRQRPSRLIFAGGTSSEGYVRLVKAESARLGVADELILTGKISEEDLAAVYRCADVFVCLSKHEGFGVPLVEAMLYDVPVVAVANTAVPWTLGRGGIQFARLDLDEIAVAVDFLAESRPLRAKVVAAQRRELSRFERGTLRYELSKILARIGITPALRVDACDSGCVKGVDWRIEGPFDSNYSLAILNRNLGRALVGQGLQIEYKSTEGPGDFTPREEFLEQNQDIAARLHNQRDPRPVVVMRNLYPPRCTRMDGVINTFALYGWEESIFPWEWVEGFNRSLDLVTTVSKFVTKVLVDSGVKIPVRTVGDGTDHFTHVEPKSLGVELLPGFRYLHNSSCFPRKGVDVLLEAFGRYFSGRSDAVLIIKTFANPHNDVVQQIADMQRRYPNAPPVQLLMDEMTDGQMATLYDLCHALVAPSRGEGFGLPITEAMLRGIPVVVTAYSGQTDFCTAETAYLVDYSFSYAKSHFAEPGSVWAEPDADSLGRAMLDVIDGDPQQRQRKIDRARGLVECEYRWSEVAKRQISAVEEIAGAAVGDLPKVVRVAWVSTWGTRCGIASYSEFLTCEFDRDNLWVLADQQPDAKEVPPKITRCWRQGDPTAGKRILDKALELRVDAVVVQYNYGFFPLRALAELIEGLARYGKICFLTLHATKDVDRADFKASFREIRDSLAQCTRLLVHSLADLNRLKKLGLTENVMLFPHGAPIPSVPSGRTKKSGFTVGTFGYALPNKGLRQVIESCARLRERGHDVCLKMINSRYPAAQSDEEITACRMLIAERLGNEKVEFDDTFHSDSEIKSLLEECDLLVFAYQETGESSSAAIRVAMSVDIPILCTPLEIFEDATIAVDRSSGGTALELAKGILEFIEDPERGERQLKRRRTWQKKILWPVLSKRLVATIQSLQGVNRHEKV